MKLGNLKDKGLK